MASMGCVPAKPAFQSQVCGKNLECTTNSSSPDPYPDTLTISSAGEANNLHPELMGDYNKSKGLFKNGRPVWKHITSDAKFYYDHILDYEGNYWLVKSDRRKITSEKSALENIPLGRWVYYDYNQGHWPIDATLTVQGW